MKRLVLLMTLLVFGAIQLLQAQAVEIRGTVTSSEDGSPMPGASVIVKGTTLGTLSDADGNYVLRVPADATELVVSFVGMKTQDVRIEGRTKIDVALETDILGQFEVVVTALGITRTRKALGYSVQDVGGDELTQAREANILNSLSGRVAGAQITSSSGSVGASTRIVLRGATSLSADNQPLFVVDGVPIDNCNFGTSDGYSGVNRGNGAADINPNDVESITVLKGPNAAALYGSRAYNGVILVTSKTGKQSRGIGVSLTNTTSFESPLRLPDFQNEYGQGFGGQFEFVDGAGGGTNDGADESWGPPLDVGLMIPQFNSPVVDGVREATPWISHPDNVKNFFETGHNIATNLAVTGGSDRASFRASFTNAVQKGVVPNTNLNKNTLALSGSVTPTRRMTVTGSGNYITTKSNNMPGLGYSGQNIMQSIASWFGRQVDIEDLRDYTNPDGSKYNWNYNYHNNPYFTLHENTNTMDRDRFMGNVRLSYQFTDWLSAFVRTGGDIYTNTNTERIAVGDIENKFGSYFESVYTNKEINTDFLISFNKDFGEHIGFTLNGGGNRRDNYYHYNSGQAPELAVPGVYNLSNSQVVPVTTNRIERKRVNSLYYSGQLSYNDALFFDFTGRNDWSSSLPPENNSYFYPSFTLSAIITDLFNIESNIFSFVKVRGSWAQVGGDTNPYSIYPTLAFGDGWNASTKLLNQYVPNEMPNAELLPQTINSLEFGADMRLFMDRLSIDFTYYTSKAFDQIIAVPISSSTGYDTKKINAGEIDNKGIELMLGITPVRREDLVWDISVNYSRNRNEVVELTEGVDRYSLGSYWATQIVAIPGEPFGDIYGPDFLRDPDGNVIHENGVPLQGETKVLGNYSPDWLAGIRSDLSWKGIGFGFLIDCRMGGDIYSMSNTWGRYSGVLEETLIGREGGIVGDGVKVAEDGTYVPNDVVVTPEEYNHAAYTNTMAYGGVFDASFVKLREVTLGYTFRNFGNVPIQDVTLSFVGRNLFLLYAKAPHIDPETAFNNSNAQGLEYGQSPSVRSLGFNVNINF